jgi:hypothetical protein
LELTGKVTAEGLRKAALYVFNGNPAHRDTLYQIATGAEGVPKVGTFKFEQVFDYISQKPTLRRSLESSLAAVATTPSRKRNIEVAGSDGDVGGGDVEAEKPADESQSRPGGNKSANKQSGSSLSMRLTSRPCVTLLQTYLVHSRH